MDGFEFDLNQEVQITISGEKGLVLARAEYVHSNPQYFIRYKTKDGRALESWWAEDALSASC